MRENVRLVSGEGTLWLTKGLASEKMKQADAQRRPSCVLLGEVLVGTTGSNNKGYRWWFCHGLAHFVSILALGQSFLIHSREWWEGTLGQSDVGEWGGLFHVQPFINFPDVFGWCMSTRSFSNFWFCPQQVHKEGSRNSELWSSAYSRCYFLVVLKKRD